MEAGGWHRRDACATNTNSDTLKRNLLLHPAWVMLP